MKSKTVIGRWVKLIREWEGSGITQRAFCQKRRISFWAFRSWRTKIRARDQAAPSVAFIELPAAPSRPSCPDGATIRISCPGGVMIETRANIEPDLLAAIIKAGRLS